VKCAPSAFAGGAHLHHRIRPDRESARFYERYEKIVEFLPIPEKPALQLALPGGSCRGCRRDSAPRSHNGRTAPELWR